MSKVKGTELCPGGMPLPAGHVSCRALCKHRNAWFSDSACSEFSCADRRHQLPGGLQGRWGLGIRMQNSSSKLWERQRIPAKSGQLLLLCQRVYRFEAPNYIIDLCSEQLKEDGSNSASFWTRRASVGGKGMEGHGRAGGKASPSSACKLANHSWQALQNCNPWLRCRQADGR